MLDLRSLKPLDEGALLALGRARPAVWSSSRRRRGPRFAAEVAAILAEKAILDLRGPVLRVTGFDVPYPYWQLEDWYMPSAARVATPCAPARVLDSRPSVAYEFKLPDLGEGLTEGEVARWLVTEGDAIAEDDPLVEIQTDKTTVEIPSPAAGMVLRILVAEGQVAPVGTVLVVIGDEGEQLLRPVETGPVAASVPPPIVSGLASEPLAAVRATPLVRRIAQELGVDLAPGRRDGRRRAHHRGGRAARGIGTTPNEGLSLVPAEGRREPVRGIRRLIVEPVTTSHREIPAVTYIEECDFTDVDRSRLVALVLKATALSLREFPELNARLDGDDIVYLDRYDLGLAVQTDQGLVVPVVRGCDVRRWTSWWWRRSAWPAPPERRARPRSSAGRRSPSRAPASWAASSSRL